jgi:hypothetical protein
MRRLRCELDVDRHGHCAGAHGAKNDRHELAAIERENAEAIPRADADALQSPGDRIAERVERLEAQLARMSGVVQVDERGA